MSNPTNEIIPACKSHSIAGQHTAIRCRDCSTIIFSINRNDFVECDCKNAPIFISGNGEFTRVGGDPSKMDAVFLKTGRKVRCKPDRLLR